MIYYSDNVYSEMNQLDVDEWQYLTRYEPKEFKENQLTENVKKNQAGYFLAGKLEGKRSDRNLKEKKVIALDYDNVDILYTKFMKVINEKLQGDQYMVYPTFNNGVKGLRLRVLINTNRSFTKEENKILATNVARLIGLPFDLASVTYSQVAGLPVITPYSSKEMIKVFDGEPLNVDSFLREVEELEKPKQKFDFQTNYQLTSNGKGKVIQLLEEFTQVVGEGRRNSFIAKAYGTLLRANMQPSLAMGFLWTMNLQFLKPPLDDKEFLKVIESITKKNNQKREEVR